MTSVLTPTQQRLRDLETLLLWEGELDNARLRAVFGVQTVQASRLIAGFVAEHGDAVTRASPHAPVVPTKNFKPRLAGSTPDEYLRLVESAGLAEVAPFIENLRLDLSPAPDELFALVNKACRHGLGLSISYRSMTDPDGSERLVYPHALVRAARRWHMRAWCTKREEFRDFALGRVGKASLVETPTTQKRQSDRDWESRARLVVVPHPGLNAKQVKLLGAEYLAGKAERVVEVRRCLVSYVVQDLRLATDVMRQTPPEYQLALKNAKDFDGEFAVNVSLCNEAKK